jgi:hypothetical protein
MFCVEREFNSEANFVGLSKLIIDLIFAGVVLGGRYSTATHAEVGGGGGGRRRGGGGGHGGGGCEGGGGKGKDE